MTEDVKDNLGSFNARMTASIIDLVVLLLLLIPFSNLLNSIIIGDEAVKVLNDIAANGTVTDTDTLYKKLLETHFFSKYIILNIITMSFTMVYVLILWIKWDASLGKWLMGLKIVDAKTGESPSIKQYFIRIFSYFLSALPLMIGFIMINYTKNHQGLHDRLAGTYVVHFRRNYSYISDFLKKLSFRRSAQ